MRFWYFFSLKFRTIFTDGAVIDFWGKTIKRYNSLGQKSEKVIRFSAPIDSGFHLAAFGSHVDHHLQHFLLYFSHVFLLSCFRVGKDCKDTKEAGHPQRSAPLSRVKNRLSVFLVRWGPATNDQHSTIGSVPLCTCSYA